MRLQIVTDHPGSSSLSAAAPGTLADEDGDGFDDETGEPVPPEDSDEDDEESDDEEEEAPDAAAGRRRWLLAVEDTWTGDGRWYAAGAFSWRDLPLPFMATDETSFGHEGARLVANLVAIEREGNEIVGYTEDVQSDDPEVLNLQRLIDQGDLRGVSVDMDNLVGEIVLTFSEDEQELMDHDDDVPDEVRIPIGGDTERLEFSAARIIGATAVPFPAFAETGQEAAAVAALVAGAGTQAVEQPADTLGVDAPDAPPAGWFSDPSLREPTPMTVTADGRVVGHLALWDSCHVGMADRCVRPPRSASSYAAFHSGSLICEGGEQVRVGQITTDAGHADMTASAQQAKQHYDHTGWAAADVRCGEDDHGIWIAGAVRPGLTARQLRAFMAADVSGDWRSVSGNLELVAVASVNVPGFVKSRLASGDRMALVASLPVCEPGPPPGYIAAADRIASTVGRSRQQLAAERDRLAFGVGRHPDQRREALRSRRLAEVR